MNQLVHPVYDLAHIDNLPFVTLSHLIDLAQWTITGRLKLNFAPFAWKSFLDFVFLISLSLILIDWLGLNVNHTWLNGKFTIKSSKWELEGMRVIFMYKSYCKGLIKSVHKQFSVEVNQNRSRRIKWIRWRIKYEIVCST